MLQPAPQHTSQPVGANRMELSGPIEPLTVPSLIHSICTSRETGVLTLRSRSVEKSAYVREGRLIFARSDDPEDRLGEMLLRDGRLNVRDLQRCTEMVAATGKRLGAILVAEGVIQPRELVDSVKEQVQEIILSFFLWTEGEYRFLMGELPTDEVITLQVNTLDLIRVGIRQILEWGRVLQAVGGLDTRYRSAIDLDTQAPDLALLPQEEELLRTLSRTASVSEVCDAMSDPDFEIYRMIWAFQTMGMVVREGEI